MSNNRQPEQTIKQNHGTNHCTIVETFVTTRVNQTQRSIVTHSGVAALANVLRIQRRRARIRQKTRVAQRLLATQLVGRVRLTALERIAFAAATTQLEVGGGQQRAQRLDVGARRRAETRAGGVELENAEAAGDGATHVDRQLVEQRLCAGAARSCPRQQRRHVGRRRQIAGANASHARTAANDLIQCKV
jgi:hypothetical protein